MTAVCLHKQCSKNCSTDVNIFMPPFEEGRAYCFAAVCRSVGRSVCRLVGSSAVSVHFLCKYWLHILKWNLIHRFIVRISRSSFILGMIEPFWTELWPLDFEKLQYFAVSVHFLCTGFTYWNEIWYTDLSWKYLGEV
jgi:hypothetical protein